jgi:parallel beta-helix repeat protein
LRNNRANNNGTGFLLASAPDNRLISNRADDNLVHGFEVAWNSNGNMLLRNKASRNGDNGIFVLDSDDVVVRDNHTFRNGIGSGIAVWNSAGALVTGNTSLRNGANGFAVFVLDGPLSVLSGNRACRNGIRDGRDFSPWLGGGAPATWTDNHFCREVEILYAVPE